MNRQQTNRIRSELLAAMVLLAAGAAGAGEKIYSYYTKPMEVDEHTFALWRFDETGYTNCHWDAGPNGLDLHGAGGNPCTALYSNGIWFSSGQYISNANYAAWNSLTNELTVELWIKLSSLVVGNGSARGILNRQPWAWNGWNRPFLLYLSGVGSNQIDMVNLRWTVRNETVSATATNLGTSWHHVLATCDVPNQILKLHLDGAQVGSIPYQLTRIPTNYFPFVMPTIFGTGTMTGYLDELRISNAVRIPKGPPLGSMIVIR